MSDVELSTVWTIGGKCSHGSHTPHWSARLNSRVRCVLERNTPREVSEMTGQDLGCILQVKKKMNLQEDPER